jgi:uncharacterized protein CbrC (UPF0167 family)
MPEPLPAFVYHPDPLATGSIAASDEVCECCGRSRGYKYESTPYCEADLEVICPWCIADGRAHEKFDVEFVDRDAIGDYGKWGKVTDAIADTVAHRTPGFSGWQQERWWVCCNDAAMFLGPAGKDELLAHGSEAVEAIRVESGFEGKEWRGYLSALSKDGGPTAYIFRCLHCGKLGGYSDCH